MLKNIYRDKDRVRRVNFINRGLFIITGGYDVKGLKKTIIWCWETAFKTPNLIEFYLYILVEYLLGHVTVIRDESRREIYFILIKLENEGSKFNESASYIIILIR